MISQEQEVVTQETAKKLVELGVRIESKWWWVDRYGFANSILAREITTSEWMASNNERFSSRNISEPYPAPTFTELWKIMPERIINFNYLWINKIFDAMGVRYENNDGVFASKNDKNPAEALGQMVCWLAEQKGLDKENK